MALFEIWFKGFLIIMSILTALWLLSVVIKDVSIIDAFWGTGFVILAFYYLYSTDNLSIRTIILTTLVSVWGLRLSLYLLWRNWGKPEDYRYQQFRKDYGEKRYWWFSFFQVFLLQGALLSLVSLTLLGTYYSTTNPSFTAFDFLAILVWIIGFAFEAGGDFQLAMFKRNPENKGKVLNTGFWKYTRHPNYFGDAAIWWSFALFAIISGSYLSIIGSVIMTYLLLKVSGVSMLERTLKKTKPEYQDYVRKTSGFFPWWQKS